MNEQLTNSVAPVLEERPSMTRKIGHTTYDVYVHFSQTSKETLTDKVMRLIRNEIDNKGVC